MRKRKFERYCKDITKVENYEKAAAVNFKGWICHHKLGAISTGGVVDAERQDLIDWGIYYDRPEDELIFVTRSEHNDIHHRGKKRSAETKRNISKSLTGRVGSLTGQHWYNNGIVNVVDYECPEGFKPGRIR